MCSQISLQERWTPVQTRSVVAVACVDSYDVALHVTLSCLHARFEVRVGATVWYEVLLHTVVAEHARLLVAVAVV